VSSSQAKFALFIAFKDVDDRNSVNNQSQTLITYYSLNSVSICMRFQTGAKSDFFDNIDILLLRCALKAF